jgi:sensor histidine kinase YesM
MGLETVLLKQEIDNLKVLMRWQSSSVSNLLDQIRVSLEEDDIDEALKIIKEFEESK